MRLEIVKDFEVMSQRAADIIIDVTRKAEGPVNICIPAGRSPKGMYKVLVDCAQNNPTIFENVNWFTLDEYVDVANDSPITCFSRLNESFYEPADISKDKVFTYNTEAKNYEEEAARFEAVIKELGGLDLAVLGIGMNGHVGFNEPGSEIYSRTRVLDLHETTMKQSENYDDHGVPRPTKGITLGIESLLESKDILIIANTTEKQSIVKAVWEEEMSSYVPASFFRTHSHAQLLIDEAAAGKLTKRG